MFRSITVCLVLEVRRLPNIETLQNEYSMNNLYRSLLKWWSTRTCLFLQTFPYAETYHNVASTYIACGHVRHGFCLPVIDLTPLPVSKNIALSLFMVRLLYNYNRFLPTSITGSDFSRSSCNLLMCVSNPPILISPLLSPYRHCSSDVGCEVV